MLNSMDATPVLSTQPPFIEAASDPDIAQRKAKQEIIAKAALLNEPRVRELIALALEAASALDRQELHIVNARLKALEFGLGGLLPPVNIRLNLSLSATRLAA